MCSQRTWESQRTRTSRSRSSMMYVNYKRLVLLFRRTRFFLTHILNEIGRNGYYSNLFTHSLIHRGRRSRRNWCRASPQRHQGHFHWNTLKLDCRSVEFLERPWTPPRGNERLPLSRFQRKTTPEPRDPDPPPRYFQSPPESLYRSNGQGLCRSNE